MVEYTYKVTWGDTDVAGIVFYPNFYKWMDQATHHFFTQIGFSTAKLFVEDKIGFPILEAKCNFNIPLFFDDDITICSKISELKDKVFTIEHEFLRKGKKVAEGYELRAWTNFSRDIPKAESIPNEVSQAVMVGI
ncbi:acyl-CoA thioesterase [Alkalihalobacillus deserti]|uniref:acyl-CoA thioesterase n=1 Tax=Alkalihalobacillus deserti TaxID=2879466 RepID=UPI001D159B8B|nr:acyl-CoA thioesterase [Alkalihalobacillus deserti]